MARLAKTTVSVTEGSNAMKDRIVSLWREEEGQDLTEYGLLLVLVALAAIATMQSLASALSNVFSNASSSLSTST
jgi:pilus assembly protein Flp/PilA